MFFGGEREIIMIRKCRRAGEVGEVDDGGNGRARRARRDFAGLGDV